MATSTINTSSKYVDLIVTTSCSLSGNYPNIKVSTSYNFKFKCTEGYASCNYNNYTFSFDGQQSKSSVNFYLDEGEISGAYGADKKEYNLGNARKITKTVKAGCDGLWDASDDISFTSPSVEAPTNYGLTVSDITEKSVKITHTLTNKRAYWRVRLKDTISKKTWNLNSNTGNGSTTISGLTANTSYTFVVEVIDRSGTVCYTSSSKSAKTLGISKVGNSPAFTLGNPFVLEITGYDDDFTHTAVFKVGSYSFTRTGLKRGSVTITPTETEIDAMYDEFVTKDDLEMSITLTTYSGSSSIGSSTGKGTVRINIEEARPLVNSFTYADTVSACTSITGSNKHVIQNASVLRVSSISATGRKGASIVKYQLVIGDRTVESTTTTIMDTGTVPSNTGVTVKAIDSRGLEGSLTIPFEKYYEYDQPRLSQLVPHRQNRVEDAVLINMVGSFVPITVNGSAKNNSCKVEYAKKKTSEVSFGSYSTITTFYGGTINRDQIVGDMDAEYSFNIRIRLSDALTTSIYECTIGKGIPNLVMGKNRIGFGRIPERETAVESAWPIYVYGDVYAGPNADQRLAYASDVEDTGWVDCTYGSGFERYSEIQAGLQVRRIGCDVHLRGIVRCLESTPSSQEGQVIIGYLPEGFAPAYYEDFVCQGSSMNRFMLRIEAKGTIEVSRYGTTSMINVPVNGWLNCFASYFIDKPVAEKYLTDESGNQLTDEAGNYLIG